MKVGREAHERRLRSGLPILNAVAVVMLLVAVWGSPPYGFFLLLKWVVVLACLANGYHAWVYRAEYLGVALILLATGGVQGFGSMRREDWVLPNLSTAVLLAGMAVVWIFTTRQGEPEEEN